MNRSNAIALGAAVALGLIAVFIANAFFSSVQQQQDAVVKQARLTRIAVATQSIPFGSPLTNTNVTLTDWPAVSVPAGAFATVEEATRHRVAIQPIVVGEPIIATRVSGTDGRATLSVNLPNDKVAVSIPINEVSGVAGFVRPGDLVDVLLTRQIPGANSGTADKLTDVVLQAVPVLAIDQVSDKQKTDPAVAKTATVQVDGYGAQKLALARELGSLTLALRNVASPVVAGAGTVTARDLGGSGIRLAVARVPAPMARPAGGMFGRGMIAAAERLPVIPAGAGAAPRLPVIAHPSGPTMTVYRKVQPTEYEVSHAY